MVGLFVLLKRIYQGSFEKFSARKEYDRVPLLPSYFILTFPLHAIFLLPRPTWLEDASYETVGVSYYPSFSLYIHKSRERANLPNKSCNHVLDRDKRLFSPGTTFSHFLILFLFFSLPSSKLIVRETFPFAINVIIGSPLIR